ncbi:hypothetical protein B0H67DRAFT_195569 [Lasiosphaeris hirsuta]|uniref:Uncharacterized protein n=1 Tax=Lasiosphaeris hirsuta TaxID=260670 RepID=A0AA40ARC4_9PEZI|nr:hypothetical protein B0H67DRAFT_195569 [Lasiosphaeris hirsuta]
MVTGKPTSGGCEESCLAGLLLCSLLCLPISGWGQENGQPGVCERAREECGTQQQIFFSFACSPRGKSGAANPHFSPTGVAPARGNSSGSVGKTTVRLKASPPLDSACQHHTEVRKKGDIAASSLSSFASLSTSHCSVFAIGKQYVGCTPRFPYLPESWPVTMPDRKSDCSDSNLAQNTYSSHADFVPAQ